MGQVKEFGFPPDPVVPQVLSVEMSLLRIEAVARGMRRVRVRYIVLFYSGVA